MALQSKTPNKHYINWIFSTHFHTCCTSLAKLHYTILIHEKLIVIIIYKNVIQYASYVILQNNDIHKIKMVNNALVFTM